MKSYRDLEIYNESKRLAINVHKLSMSFPKFEMYEEGSQIRRSSKSVTSLIVEGYGRRRYKADFIKYLVYAQSECDETMVHLEFLFESGSMTDGENYQQIKTEYDLLSKRINKFIQWVEEHWNENIEQSKLRCCQLPVAGFQLLKTCNRKLIEDNQNKNIEQDINNR